jgi:hypothetical protein
VAGSPLIRSRYHRIGFREHLQVGHGSFSQQACVRHEKLDAPGNANFRLQWV